MCNGVIPVLELPPDGTIIQDSKVILDYIAERYENQSYSLYPEDVVKRA